MKRVLLAVALVAATALASDDERCMPMSSITALSFQPGQTTGRERTGNVPTMTCRGNCPTHFLAAAQCRQVGLSDNGLPSWRCTGQFQGVAREQRLLIGSVRVKCEGCSRPGDSNVAKGSCALDYSVITRNRVRREHRTASMDSGDNGMLGTFLLSLLFFGGVVGLCWCCMAQRQAQQRYDPQCAQGVPVGGAPGYGYGGGYGGGFGGLGTGMFMGYLMGSSMGGGWGGHGGGHGGGYDAAPTTEYYDDGGYVGGDGMGGYDGGFGGTDAL